MAKVNGEYWAQRIAELEEKLLLSGEEYLKRLGAETAKAIRRTEADIARWYNRFAKNNKITLAEAKKWLTAKELKELRWTVDEYIEYAEANELDPRWVKELENASARVHISRLEALKLDLRHNAEAIGAFQKNGAVKVFETVYKDGYFRTGFEFQRAFGIGWSLGSGVDEERIRKVLAAPWTTDGKTFSDRIWSNQEALVSELSMALTQMIMRGEGPLETAEAIAKKFNVNRSRAATLVYTESAAFAELSRNDCYSDLGVEMCRVDGTLDGVTCANCGTMDGTVLRLADCKVGISTPPFHPRCRCTTVPHYDDWDEFDITPERIARNIDTGEHFEVPANMTYEQWKAEQDARYGAGSVDKKRKMHYNEKADRAQYQRYIDVLGDDAPNTFLDFQSIKYSDRYLSLRVRYEDQRLRIRIKNGGFPIAVLTGKQGKHILGHNNYILGRSYLVQDINVQELVNNYCGTGRIVRDIKGKWVRKEIVTADAIVGYDVSLFDKSETPTRSFVIHYSKNGVHIVPKKE